MKRLAGMWHLCRELYQWMGAQCLQLRFRYYFCLKSFTFFCSFGVFYYLLMVIKQSLQPLFTHPRPKRCATHCYIARNISYLQQLMKINPFWPPASASVSPMFGSKPSTELQSHMPQSMQDKSQQVGIFPGQTTVKDTKSSQTTSIPDPTLRKQQVLLQQAMPPGTPNNILVS